MPSYTTLDKVKDLLGIETTNLDSELTECISWAEAYMNSILSEFTTTPVTSNDDLERIATQLAAGYFRTNYLQPFDDVLTQGRLQIDQAKESLQRYVEMTYGGKTYYSPAKFEKASPETTVLSSEDVL